MMTISPVSGEKVAETSSKGNQEKWREGNRWYKLDQFGYEALSEVLVSLLLEKSNVETQLPFSFVRYQMGKRRVHGYDRTGCVSDHFLGSGQSLITVNRLLTQYLGYPLREKLLRLSSDKRRIAYLAEATAAYTGLEAFPQYLTLLFEMDDLFCNDDRHLNNIAVLWEEGRYDYCPIFDNGAALLSNMRFFPVDIAPRALIASLRARPFLTTFTRQRNAARSMYGRQLVLPIWKAEEIHQLVTPLLAYYPVRDRDLIRERVTTCILLRQKLVLGSL